MLPPERELDTTEDDAQLRATWSMTALFDDYKATRDDARAAAQRLWATVVSFVGTLALLYANPSFCLLNKSPGCGQPPPVVIIGAPILPLIVLLLLQTLGAEQANRSYYLREIEHRIRVRLSTARPAELPVPAWAEIDAAFFGAGYGIVLSRIAFMIISGGGVVLLAWITFTTLAELPLPIGALSIFLYGIAGFYLVAQFVGDATSGYRNFKRVCRAAEVRIETYPGTEARRHARRLRTYLLLPKPNDLAKAQVTVIGLAVGVAMVSGGGVPLDAWLFVAAFELLIYQARYQWNDLRGLPEDSVHPSREVRARLPIGANPKSDMQSSMSAALARLVLAILVGVAIQRLPEMVIVVALVFGLGAIYEAIRTHIRAPLLSAAATVGIVSFGGVLRIAVGIYLGAGTAGQLMAGAVLGILVATYFFQIAGNAMGWALEATQFIVESHGALRMQSTVERKPHLIGLATIFFGVQPEPLIGDGDIFPLRGRGVLLQARKWWRLPAVMAIVFGCVSLVLSAPRPVSLILGAGLMAAGTLAVFCANLNGTVARLVAFSSVVLTVVLVLVFLLPASIGSYHRPIWSAALWPVVVLAWGTSTVLFLLVSSYEDIQGLGARILAALKGVNRGAQRAILGPATYDRYFG